MTIGKEICEHIKKLNEVHLYVVSNVPFRGIYSTQKTVSALKK